MEKQDSQRDSAKAKLFLKDFDPMIRFIVQEAKQYGLVVKLLVEEGQKDGLPGSIIHFGGGKTETVVDDTSCAVSVTARKGEPNYVVSHHDRKVDIGNPKGTRTLLFLMMFSVPFSDTEHRAFGLYF